MSLGYTVKFKKISQEKIAWVKYIITLGKDFHTITLQKLLTQRASSLISVKYPLALRILNAAVKIKSL